jgi:hypothetical protein
LSTSSVSAPATPYVEPKGFGDCCHGVDRRQFIAACIDDIWLKWRFLTKADRASSAK